MEAIENLFSPSTRDSFIKSRKSFSISSSASESEVSFESLLPDGFTKRRSLANFSPNQPEVRELAETYKQKVLDRYGQDVYEGFKVLAYLRSSLCLSYAKKEPLPTKKGRRILVLDLDETLVHSSLVPISNPNFIIELWINEKKHEVYVRLRPHLIHFLNKVCQMFNVYVFTASRKIYADKLLNLIDKSGGIRKRFYREHCVQIEGCYVKKLRNVIIDENDYDHALLVDNSPTAFLFDLEKGIPIKSWFGDSTDEELLNLLVFLERISTLEDCKNIIGKKFGILKILKFIEEYDNVI